MIAVDNGSSDAGADLIAREFRLVRLLRSAAALGFSGACNLGIRRALADVPQPDAIVLLNQDTVVDPGWLHALLLPLADPSVGAVGSLASGPLMHGGGFGLLALLGAFFGAGVVLVAVRAGLSIRVDVPVHVPAGGQPLEHAVQRLDADVRAVVPVAKSSRRGVGEQDVDGPGGAPLPAPDPAQQAGGAAAELALGVVLDREQRAVAEIEAHPWASLVRGQ